MDRLSLSFPVRKWEGDRSAWSTISVRQPGSPMAAETRSGFVDVAGKVRAFVGVSEVNGGETWAKVEFNPSRVEDPDGVSLAPVEALAKVVPLVLRKASELVDVDQAVTDARVKRLDVARDFTDVERSDFYLRGLGPVRRPWARRNLVHFDPSRNGAQTLMVGSGAGSVRLYDKHAESQGKAAPGTLRWEVEARGGWAKNYGGIRALEDLTRSNVEALAQNRWEWSAMGVEVSAADRVIEKVQRSELSPAKQRSFLGWLFLQSRGMASPLSKETAAGFNRLARELDVALGPQDADVLGFVGRLDFDSGREVLRCA
ncbi:MAG: hypothetical protein M3285_14180 [Actinomycetota bacterium]|nr:hypothetical protein [Actinomycetota bacterium]